jgi:hypothetical protein
MDIEFIEVIKRARTFLLTPENIRAIRNAIDSGEWREDVRANAWVGRVIGEVLKLDPKADRQVIKQMLSALIAAGDLKIVWGVDHHRHSAPFVVIA